MQTVSEQDLAQLGRDVASEVLGADKIDNVTVTVRTDARDELAYFFEVAMSPDASRPYGAKNRIRLGLALTKALGERGDETFPHVELVTPEDWKHLHGA